jgi:nitrogenase subunit NifH
MAYGRWATPLNDNKMHNVMTLISPEVMVTLYSTDNVNATIVVQQLRGSDSNGILWDDCGAYKGNQLDFVDNGSTSVPGQ